MNPLKRKQQVVTVNDGRTHHVALCRGFRDALPVFGWGEAPSTLLSRSQLREIGMRPGGADPVALLVFRHHKPYRHEETTELFSVELALPVRGTAAQRRAKVRNALRARRICQTCREDVGYYVPTSTRQCWTCEGIDLAAATEVAA
ncbi:MAG TPA: RRQRL motif-containing zinc-binding protein [Amycolatopsis sp.]|nr:RRQRL motif-containing zinc-binding protein [Amycolatopsis sp.]